MDNLLSRRLLALLGATLAGSAALAAQTGTAEAPLAALARLEPGLWQMREIGNPNAAPLKLCVADPAVLMQLQHRQAPCSRLVISNDTNQATVHYTCPANGFGRTSLKVETPRLAKIDTQGIMDKLPFEFRFEARRVGECPTARNRR